MNDLMRLPLGILTGVGFIGRGAILRRDNIVVGATTAATPVGTSATSARTIPTARVGDLPQQAVRSPREESDLAHQLRLHPVNARNLKRRAETRSARRRCGG